jgi:signal peptidase II
MRIALFLVIPVLLCIWLFYLFIKSLSGKYYMSVAYCLILAGAIGNLIDRFILGYVVDFLDFHFKGHHFPAFNIADSSITIAAFLLIYDYIQEEIINRKKKKLQNS